MADFLAELRRRHIYRVPALAVLMGVALYQLLAPPPDRTASPPAPLLIPLMDPYRDFNPVLGARWEAIDFTTSDGQEDARGWGTVEFGGPLRPETRSVLVRGSCNSTFGPYLLSANHGIRIELNQTTLVACTGLEDRLRTLVESAKSYSLRNGDLFLDVPSSIRGAGTLQLRRCSVEQIRGANQKKGECSWSVRAGFSAPSFSEDQFGQPPVIGQPSAKQPGK
jgi:hypothetical protein